jgi:hypothetical protein
MENIEIDFRCGCGSDEEIILSISTDIYQKKLRIWEGYFNAIVSQIELSADGTWTGIAYYFHLFLGWNKEENWQIPDLNEALLQFKSINMPEDRLIYENAREVLVEIIEFLSEASEKNLPVYIFLG